MSDVHKPVHITKEQAIQMGIISGGSFGSQEKSATTKKDVNRAIGKRRWTPERGRKQKENEEKRLEKEKLKKKKLKEQKRKQRVKALHKAEHKINRTINKSVGGVLRHVAATPSQRSAAVKRKLTIH
jgi:hypothetical protein